ncbi:MAG: CocE/NonD family hydrolase, partial [Xanthomonadales bacterium]|nr:CocE/NonD family hydrolase [Xanthomonadales bacterium]
AAVEHPPKLVTITPTATWSSFYRNLYLGGAVRHALIAKWASGNSPMPEDATVTSDWNRTLAHLPLSEIDDQVGWPIPWLEGMLTHPSPSGYWKRLDLTEDMLELRLPMQHVVGYYDFFSRESVNNFTRMQQLAKDPATRSHQRLILGPWDHGTIGKSLVGEVDFGSEAQWDATAATLDWFDRTLKEGSDGAATSIVPVRYFVMGENRWHEAETWPPSGHEPTSFYLHSAGQANTRDGNGRLSRTAPKVDEPVDRFRADPADPAPACPVTDQRPLHAAIWAPVDQRPIEDRADVLCYTTEPLNEPLTFAGNASAELFVAADTPDADWVVKLIDVYPNDVPENAAQGAKPSMAGFELGIGIEIFRGRYHSGFATPSALTPGKTEHYQWALPDVDHVFLPGHRIMVQVQSSLFPLYDRNPQTYVENIMYAKKDDYRKATQSIWFGGDTASAIVLPVVP